jgi:hypothetical protein
LIVVGLIRPSIGQAFASDALEGVSGAHIIIDAERNAVRIKKSNSDR